MSKEYFINKWGSSWVIAKVTYVHLDVGWDDIQTAVKISVISVGDYNQKIKENQWILVSST